MGQNSVHDIHNVRMENIVFVWATNEYVLLRHMTGNRVNVYIFMSTQEERVHTRARICVR